ncbi:nucleolar protein (nucleomorph) [Lotharella oceanica]|uniref:Nucleolar protein n=1 Tax=Lotharella oceanica TaxID=641309 RepID=A0A060D7N6_9EUKA|nr:nucleolar protein [Lotharella oceanica]
MNKNIIYEINSEMEKNRTKILNFIKIKRYAINTLKKNFNLQYRKINFILSLRIANNLIIKKTLVYPKIEDINIIYDYALLVNIGNQIKLAFEKLNDICFISVNKSQVYNSCSLFNLLKMEKNNTISNLYNYNTNYKQIYNLFYEKNCIDYFLNKSKINKMWKYLYKIIKMYQTIKNNLFKKILLYTPNLSSLVGEHIAAQLVFKTHGLVNLARLPASSLSNLSFSLLYNIYEKNIYNKKQRIIKYSYLVSQSNIINRHKIIRILSNKSSLCSRIDLFDLGNITFNYGFNFRGIIENKIQIMENT